MRRPGLRRADLGGVIGAVVFVCGSLTPSLLPRPWLFQGIVSGILVTIGYALGALVTRIVRSVRGQRRAPKVRPLTWWVVGTVGAVATLVMLWLNARWQRGLYDLVGLTPPSRWGSLVGVLVAVLLATLAVVVARLLRRATTAVARTLAGWLPRRLALPLAGAVVAVAVVAFLDGVAGRSLFFVADQVFRVSAGAGTETGDRPVSGLRSGSAASLVDWADLGSQGHRFVSGGPSRDEIAAFTGDPARVPVRVYAGLTSEADVQERAELVVDELERTGGFDRAVLCVMTATGTGWIDDTAADALELLWGGDTALASMQYSYLPSWVSHLADGTRARVAGQALFDAVYRRYDELPSGDRPLLLVFGESLGADGSQSAFSSIADVRNRTDGALWVGPPGFSSLWSQVTADRDRGTPAYEPVYNGGEAVRFADDPVDLRSGDGWSRPRVVFLQHPTDPVVWWSPRLILHRPDWLAEPHGPGVMPQMRWYPVVTFWQVTADLTNALQVPPGFGHNYGALQADAWAAVAPPPGWTSADTERLRTAVAARLDDRQTGGT